jgi:hypothetical protein
MKPISQSGSAERLSWGGRSAASRFPRIESCFLSGLGDWHGFSSSSDGYDSTPVRRFHNFSREFLTESAREQKREAFVLGLIVLTSAWPVIYMVITVVKLLSQGHPLA